MPQRKQDIVAAPKWPVATKGEPGTAAATAQQADDAVRALVTAALDRAAVWLQTHRETLDAATQQLLQRETLGEEDLLALAGLPARGDPGWISER